MSDLLQWRQWRRQHQIKKIVKLNLRDFTSLHFLVHVIASHTKINMFVTSCWRFLLTYFCKWDKKRSNQHLNKYNLVRFLVHNNILSSKPTSILNILCICVCVWVSYSHIHKSHCWCFYRESHSTFKEWMIKDFINIFIGN